MAVRWPAGHGRCAYRSTSSGAGRAGCRTPRRSSCAHGSADSRSLVSGSAAGGGARAGFLVSGWWRMSGPGGISPDSVADAGAFLARLVRMDRATVVRLRPEPDGTVALWAPLPFGVLVTRRIRADLAADVTVAAGELLDTLAAGTGPMPPRQDARWRWPVPSGPGRVVERLPAAELRRVGEAAARTLRAAVAEGVRGRAVGER